MKNKKSLFTIFLGFLVALFSFLGVLFYQGEVPSSVDLVEVVEVIDGDTIRVREVGGEEVFRVRYLGVDTPELEGESFETCFGSEAKEKNEELVSGRKLVLEYDKDKYDRFGRVLSYVFVLDDRGEKEVFVNLKLLEEGYGRFYLDKQNVLFQNELVEGSLSAQGGFLGLWGSCGEEEFNGECVIKGNIDRLGRKYYHLPGDKYYSLTKINLLEEEEWLCAPGEAEAKNFSRALESF